MHVRLATVTDVPEAATVPRASLVSLTARDGSHLPGPSSTAAPPLVPPPSLPLLKPPDELELKADERFPSSLTCGSWA